MRLSLLLICALALPAQEAKTYENLNAVLWTQSAVERAAQARQTYRAAEQGLRSALEDSHWTAALEQNGGHENLPPAVILDLDETVLDNSAIEARWTKQGKAFNAPDWSKWVAEERAGLVPGAIEFLKFVHGEGVAAFYVTNRVCDPSKSDDPTARLLRKLSVPLADGRLLCKSKDADPGDKSARRARVAATHRVLLLVGDDFNDFVTAPPDRDGRAYLLRAHERFFGERWFILPNPMYGSWERAVGTDVAKKLGALKE